MTSLFEKRKANSEDLITILKQIQGVIVSPIPQEDRENALESLALELSELLGKLDKDLLPYSAVSQFVYNDDKSEDILYFVERLEEKFSIIHDKEDDHVYIKFVKLMEHLKLAKQQKDYLFLRQEDEIEKLRHSKVLIQEQSKKSETINKDIQKLRNDIKNITAQFITILGIFAAILLGSFGAIQGFTSLFANADKLQVGEILIISSIGASTVLLILFFLLNSIAKLIGKSLAQANGNSVIERYPFIVISFGLITFLSLIGTSLELSVITLKFAWQGLWWLLPLVWIVFFFYSLYKRSFWFFRRKIEDPNETAILSEDGD
ncbi:hypothetical protein [Paenibacillus koleovorans]|uniref:hypothetical protein n=1 Tax=Paenibacillus koleovorans TaxID=121608 RepID=UPI000FDCDC2A|nr:hypothetical protein [Paenibacillus koleovorans]